MTLSPLVAKGKVVVGVSGGEFGVRGYIVGLDAETGAGGLEDLHRPGPGEPGHETWKGEAWKTGGASVWMQGNYDTESGLAFFGTGNGGPWMPDTRPGDNLYSSSVVAIDVETGAIKGYHQYHWNDAWDWDEVSAPLLIDVERDGETVKGLVHAGRNGYLWTLERTPRARSTSSTAKPFVRQNVFAEIDPKDGRPSYNDERIPGTNKTVTFCPSLWGGKDWPPEAYNPDTRLFYIPAHENLCSELGGVPIDEREPGELYIGIPIDVILSSLRFHDSVEPAQPVEIGQLQAWDLNKGEMVWSHGFEDSEFWGPVLTTAGNLVFAGGTTDRKFRAFDATTGDVLWEFTTNSGVTGVPSSFAVDGTQYIAVQSGWGVDAERMRALLAEMLPGRVPAVPQGGVHLGVRAQGPDVRARRAERRGEGRRAMAVRLGAVGPRLLAACTALAARAAAAAELPQDRRGAARDVAQRDREPRLRAHRGAGQLGGRGHHQAPGGRLPDPSWPRPADPRDRARADPGGAVSTRRSRPSGSSRTWCSRSGCGWCTTSRRSMRAASARPRCFWWGARKASIASGS